MFEMKSRDELAKQINRIKPDKDIITLHGDIYNSLVEEPGELYDVIDSEHTGLFLSAFSSMPMVLSKDSIRYAGTIGCQTATFNGDTSANNISSIGFLNILQSYGYYRIEMIIYCNCSETFINHVIYHLHHVLRVTRGNGRFILAVISLEKAKYDRNAVDDQLIKILGSRQLVSGQDITQAFLMKMPINEQI